MCWDWVGGLRRSGSCARDVNQQCGWLAGVGLKPNLYNFNMLLACHSFEIGVAVSQCPVLATGGGGGRRIISLIITIGHRALVARKIGAATFLLLPLSFIRNHPLSPPHIDEKGVIFASAERKKSCWRRVGEGGG